jgi:NADH-quinone oxidoreductase subunit G
MPVNEMWNCDRGRFGYGHLTAAARVTTPLVRSGGDLAEASWADALLTTVRAMRDDEGHIKRVAVLSGGRLADEDAYAASKFARTVLGTDDVDFRTRFADRGELDGLSALHGRDTATYADVEKAPVILTVGLDPEEEVPILHLRIRKAWRKHTAKIVPVGPRAGSLEEYAWRRLVTDVDGETGALAALGRAAGVASLADAAATSGYTSPHLDDVLQALKGDGQPVVLVGERAPAGALAAAGLVADAVGGKVAWVPRRSNARGALDTGLAAGLLPGGRRLDDDADRATVADAWGADLPAERGRDLLAILEAAAAGQIDVLYLLGVDLARDCVSPALAEKALKKATVIVQDLAENATTAHADVVLPVTASQERVGSRTNWEGRSQRFSHAVEGPQLVRDDWEILVQLAGLLGGDLGFHDLDGLRIERDRLGMRGGVRSWPAVAAPVADGEEQADGLALTTSHLLLDRATMLADADDLNATAKEPWVALHPADADILGVDNGVVVDVAGDVTLRLPVRITADQAPGTVFVPANSTETPATALGDAASGPIRVTVAAAGEGTADD